MSNIRQSVSLERVSGKFIILTLLAGLLFSLGIANRADAYNANYVHFEFRWNSPYDNTYRQQKWTKSAYHLNSTSNSVTYYTAVPWGHSYKAGRTGNVSVGPARKIYTGKYKLTNYLVESYGTGNNAWIASTSYSNGHAYGSWSAD